MTTETTDTGETPNKKKRGSKRGNGEASPEAAPAAAPAPLPAAVSKLLDDQASAATEGVVASFIIDAGVFAKALGLVKGASTAKSTMPVLGSTLIRANRGDEGVGRVYLAATDLELSLTTSFEADVRRSGAIAVPTKTLVEILRALPKGPVVFQMDRRNYVELRAGKVHYRIAGQAAESFPKVPELAVDAQPVDAGALRELLGRVAYATSRDETRYTLTGVFLENVAAAGDLPAGIRAVATDGHRLAIADARWPSAPKLPAKGVVVPRKGVDEMLKLLDRSTGEDATARFGIAGNAIVLERADVKLTSQLVDGQFPDYRQVMPGPPTSVVLVEKALLEGVLQRVATIAHGKDARSVRIDFKPAAMAFSARVVDVGDFDEEVECETSAETKPIALPIAHLREALEVVEEERVRLRFIDTLSPAVLVGAEDDGAEVVSVIMPFRL